MKPALRVFVSCVSQEFGTYRTELRTALTSAGREIKVQEDFQDGPGTLLEKLDHYIKNCQAVIHLVGEGTGSRAKPAEIRWLLEAYPDLPVVLPELGIAQADSDRPFSYSQWECYLAIYHRVPCYIYLADTQSRRDSSWSATPASITDQQVHIERLKRLGHDRRREVFSDAKDVALRFLSSYFDDRGQSPATVKVEDVILWPAAPPESNHRIADREPEFKAFRALISGQSAERALLIHGPSDRGKSVLLWQFREFARELPGLLIAHAEFKTALPLSDVLSSVRRDLKDLRFPRFDREANQSRRPEMLRAAFLEDLQESPEPVLLLLDAFEQATEEAKQWVENHLLPRCRQHDGLRMVIAGKESPECSAVLSEFILRLELPPIRDPASWCDYNHRVLRVQALPDDHLATLVTAADGSPRAIGGLLENLRRAGSQP